MRQRLSLADLTPGMVLADVLRRKDGALLLPADTVLTARHLALFPTWGVTWAVVREPEETSVTAAPPPPEQSIPPAQWQETAALIRPRFVHAHLDQPAMACVFNLCVPRAALRLAEHDRASLVLPALVPVESLPPLPGTSVPGPMALVALEPKLTTLPDVFVRISEVLNDPLSTSREAAEAIGRDTGLSAVLLRLVNSAFYGFPVKVDTLSRAVTIVGSRQLTTLALGLSVLALFKDLPEGLVDMRSFWKHSIGCGVLAAALAGPDGGLEVERLFVAGLLHDVGRLVLYRCLPRHMAHILAGARAEGRLLREAERRALGYDHALLGGMLLKRWRFPENLEKAVRQHHGLPAHQVLPMSAAVHVANVLVGALGLGSSGEVYVPPLSPLAWDTLRLSPERVTTVVEMAATQIGDILRVFLPDEA